MDSFGFINLQAEKANAMLKHRKLRRIASLLRLVEVCVVLLLISRVPLQLPVALAVKNSSEYFRDFSVFMNSPRFVFLVGNAIIITLFAQSAHASRKNNPEPDLYHELIKNSTKNQGDPEKQKTGTEDGIKNRRISGKLEKYPENHRMYYSIKKQGIDANKDLEVKGYRRCQTEILRRVESEKKKPLHVLRRCETENRRKMIQSATHEEVAAIPYPEDDISNEEFRCIVEAFIARQQKLRREEGYS